MKFGFNAYGNPIEKCLYYASRHNLDHIEIDLTKEHSSIQTFTRKRIHSLVKLSKLYDIELSLHTPYSINPADMIPMIRKSYVKYLKNCVKIAHRLNATHVTVHIGFYKGLPFWQGMRKNALKRLVRSLNEVLKSCEKYNVKIALENAVPLKTGAEIFYLGDSVKDFEYIFKEIDSKFLNLCLDTGHANINNEVLNFLNQFGHKIINIHYHDNDGLKDNHLGIGEGNIPWKDVVPVLKKLNFKGPFISESFNMKPHNSTNILAGYFSES